MKRWLINILLVVFSGIFLVSAYLLVDYFLESRKQQEQFSDLAALMENAAPPTDGSPDIQISSDATEPTQPQSSLVQVKDPETGEMVEMLPEFAPLYELNNDIVGWICIDDTNVNYPVMQTPDSADYYLYRNYDRESSSHGCIYAREACDVAAPSDNITIYGHRMNDGSMFNDLYKYSRKDFWETHKYITFNTLTEHHTYEIICVFTIASNLDTPFQYHQFVDAADEAHFDEFIRNCQSYALYDTGLSASYGDKLISLSTCEYSQVNGRLVVVAKRIDTSAEN